MSHGGPDDGQPDTPPTTTQKDPAEAERHTRKEEEKKGYQIRLRSLLQKQTVGQHGLTYCNGRLQ